MRTEYNFARATRGKYAKRVVMSRLVLLDDDVAARFSTARSVNEALRTVAINKRRKAG